MVEKMVTHITDALGGTLGGVGSAVVDFFDKTVITETGDLTTFAGWALAFLGISFGLAVLKFIPNLVRR